MNYLFKSFLLILSIITFSSCRNLTPYEESLEKKHREEYPKLFEYFYGWEWQFEEFGESLSYDVLTGYRVPPGQAYSITFQKDGTFTAKAYCSTFSGRYKVNGTEISFSKIKVNYGSCTDNKFEKRFVEALKDVYEYRISEIHISLFYESNKWLMFYTNTEIGTPSQATEVESFSNIRSGSAPFKVVNYAIVTDDLLFITVEYRGCQKHNFTLYAGDDTFNNSRYPVAVDVLLTHSDELDTCSNVITELLRFDIRTFKEVHSRRYGPMSGQLNLRINGLNSQPAFVQDILYYF